MVELGDGSMGMLPEEWLKKYGMLADLGLRRENGSLRFSQSQAGLLDALLAAQPEIQRRRRLREGPAEPPHVRGGRSRSTRRRASTASCGPISARAWAGSTTSSGSASAASSPTTWAWARRCRCWRCCSAGGPRRQAKGPSLARRPPLAGLQLDRRRPSKFTPRLRVLDYTGPGRHALREQFRDYDLIVTTYGTLRTDIAELAQFEFDYVILDEAQAIKNAESQAAKAARLLASRYRLAMSGTPIENHLGELWSIFEFLNPGMLGTDTVFKRLRRQQRRARGRGSRDSLAKALRPFILRRTKAAGRQGPAREDRADALLRHGARAAPALRRAADALPRARCCARTAAELNRSKIEVLEALLRLRQAACHPGLIDPDLRRPSRSAKLDMLLPSDRRGRRGRAQGPGLLAVHQLPGDRPRAARRRRGSPTNTSTAGPATAPRRSSGSRPTRSARSS